MLSFSLALRIHQLLQCLVRFLYREGHQHSKAYRGTPLHLLQSDVMARLKVLATMATLSHLYNKHLPVIAAEWLAPAAIDTMGWVFVSTTGLGSQHSSSSSPWPSSPLLPSPQEYMAPLSEGKLWSHYCLISPSWVIFLFLIVVELMF